MTGKEDDIMADLSIQSKEDSTRQKSFETIQTMIKEDPGNFQAYINLGTWYESENIDQAYLTYEHAGYLCKRKAEADGASPDEYRDVLSDLKRKLMRLKQDARFHVHPASFIIVSWNTLDLTKKCLESIRETCDPDACEIVIVDNGSHDGSKEWLREQKDIVFVDNDYNAGFPGGCNLGFRAASQQNDMLLLNSDTEMTENAFYTLRMGLYSDRRNGMAGGFSNANYLNEFSDNAPKLPEENEYYEYGRRVNIPGMNQILRKSVLFAFYVLVRRDVFNKVGEWDELFNPGNFDDHDYSYRVLKAGYRNILCWNSFIIHRAHRTFAQNHVPHNGIMRTNFDKFFRKWGFGPDEYSNTHLDMISLITHGREEAFSVLFIDCGCGNALCTMEKRFPYIQCYGLEKSPIIAQMGAAMANVAECDIERMDIPWNDQLFDYIMIADTLESCNDPEQVLRIADRYLKPGGAVICSVETVLNAKMISDLLKGSFFRKEKNDLPSRKVNFFTMNDMCQMFMKTGFQIEFVFSIVLREINTNYDRELFDKLCSIQGVVDRKRFDEHHVVFRLRKRVTSHDI